ncbi:Bug family tripartite tricarboxylate transporter substrate binding protein [Allopusillimonas soli]|nr:tripartite tricarboxylate transporter substrate binding protein [Allopusillimonas soli]
MMAQRLSEDLGQPVVVENKPGAGGQLGTEAVARASNDGYTILYGTQGTIAAAPALYKTLAYNPDKDFVPVHAMFATPNILVSAKNRPYKSVKELVSYAKAHPEKVNMASSGMGTGSHMTGESFQMAAGIKMLHVPYKGSAPALNDLLGGQVDVLFDYPVSSGPHIKSGDLIALAVTANKRLASFPDIPSIVEAGYPQAVNSSWSGIFVPAGTPSEIVNRLSAAIDKALASEEIKEYASKYGAEILADLSGTKFTKFIQEERKHWQDVVDYSGVHLDPK